MTKVQTLVKLTLAGAVAALAAAASAQDATMTMDATMSADASTADAFTQAPPQTFSRTGKPTSASPRMIQEAIQRSQARTQRLRTQGVPEQFGSEEPFSFNPAVK
jgi:hypothetical protein